MTECVCCYCVRMDEDDDSCVMKYIEIVPHDNFANSLDSTDVQFDPFHVKVCSLIYHFPRTYVQLSAIFIVYAVVCQVCGYRSVFTLSSIASQNATQIDPPCDSNCHTCRTSV